MKQSFTVFTVLLFLVVLKEASALTWIYSVENGSLTVEVANVQNDSAQIQLKSLALDIFRYSVRVWDFRERLVPCTKVHISYGLRYDMKGLRAGETYYYQLYKSKEYNYESNKFLGEPRSFTTIPNPPASFTYVSHTDKKITIHWLPPVVNCTISHYQVVIEPLGGWRLPTTREREAIFDDLVPGRLYTFTVRTVSNYEASEPIIFRQRTKPAPPINVSLRLVDSPRKIQVKWSNPLNADFDKFAILVQLQRDYSTAFENVTSLIELSPNQIKDSHFWISENFIFCGVYRVILQTISGEVYSDPVQNSIRVEVC